MVMVFRYPWLVAFVVLLVCTSCKHTINPPSDPLPVETTTTSVHGFVTDDGGVPMSGVRVTAHGQIAVTSVFGEYRISDGTVPADRVCAIAQQDGYFTAARAAVPVQHGETFIPIVMQKITTRSTVSGTNGGMASDGGASVIFPPRSFQTLDGNPATTDVTVGISYMNPDSVATFSSLFAGDASAIRTDASLAQLVSYGVLRVQVTDADGRRVMLRPGIVAQLRYPIPSLHADARPDGMPLWYFDEAGGYWKEEGQAIRHGDVFEGTVSHFTDWNCDVPVLTAWIEGTVRCSDGDLVPYARVNVGQIEVRTDSNGRYRSNVPANTAFKIFLLPDRNNGMVADPISVDPITPGGTRSVVLNTLHCPATLTGTIVDCKDAPIGGFLRLRSAQSGQIIPVPSGNFSIRVPRDEALTLRASSIDAQTSGERSLSPVHSDTLLNIGPIKACDQPQESFQDISVGSWDAQGIAFMHTSASIAVAGGKVVQFYNTTSAALERAIDVTSYVPAVFTGRRLMVSDDDSVLAIEGYTFQTVCVKTGSGVGTSFVKSVSHSYLSSNGTYVVTVDSTAHIITYDVATGTTLRTLSLTGPFGIALDGIQQGGTKSVATVWGSTPYTIVWDNASDAQVLKTAVTDGRDAMCELSADGRIQGFLSTFQGLQIGSVNFYDLFTGEMISSQSFNRFNVNNIRPRAISPNNVHYVAIRTDAAGSGFPVILSIANGKDVKVLPIPSLDAQAWSFAFDKTGSHLAILFHSKSGNIIRVYSL